MRVLLVDPTASLNDPAFLSQRFDRVIALGILAQSTREVLQARLQCPIEAAATLGAKDFQRIRYIFRARLGELVDEHGIDWWELATVKLHEQIELVLRLQKVALQIQAEEEAFISGYGVRAQIIERLLKRPLHVFQSRPGFGAVRHYLKVFGRLSLTELLQIGADKYDAGYRLRGMVARRSKPSASPVVLLPSAYVNASRTALRYAEALPETEFLLISTRASARDVVCPGNVSSNNLACYALGTSDQREFEKLLDKWEQLKNALMRYEEFSILDQLGAFTFVPKFLREGLAVRDAWVKVLETEAVSAVLCADEANPFTCIPVMIARHRGVPTIACHHGALDGRYRFLRVRAEVFLAKGRMEREYLVRDCGVESEKVEVSAASVEFPPAESQKPKRFIVFFSEPYEILGSRCAEIYNDVLPPLAALAAATGHELLIKLHPFESRRERARIMKGALGASELALTRIVSGPLGDELLSQTWCALTVISSTAVDCTMRGIPVFLCKWLDGSHYGYAEQFAKFGAGTLLRCASEIHDIPLMIENSPRRSAKDLCEPVAAGRLRALLKGDVSMAAAV